MQFSNDHEAPSTISTLSRNALYAPLSSFTNESVSSNKVVASNLREKNLSSFFESVSYEYHNSVSPLGTRNGASNGRQGLKAQSLYQKLEQRALTLIKGGVSKSIVKGTNEMVVEKNHTHRGMRNARNIKRLAGSMSKNKRKEKLTGRKGVAFKSKFVRGSILLALNQSWNKYMNHLAKIKRISFSSDGADFTPLIAQAEFIGAKAFIKTSKSTSYSGKTGIIIDSTRNVWKVALPTKGAVAIDDVFFHHSNKWKTVLIPKKDSNLEIKIHYEGVPDPVRIDICGEDFF